MTYPTTTRPGAAITRLALVPGGTPTEPTPAERLTAAADTLIAMIGEGRPISECGGLPITLMEIAAELRAAQRIRTTPTQADNTIAAIRAAQTPVDLDDVFVGCVVPMVEMTTDERVRVLTEYLIRNIRVGRDGK